MGGQQPPLSGPLPPCWPVWTFISVRPAPEAPGCCEPPRTWITGLGTSETLCAVHFIILCQRKQKFSAPDPGFTTHSSQVAPVPLHPVKDPLIWANAVGSTLPQTSSCPPTRGAVGEILDISKPQSEEDSTVICLQTDEGPGAAPIFPPTGKRGQVPASHSTSPWTAAASGQAGVAPGL